VVRGFHDDKEHDMAGTPQTIRRDRYGTPADEIAPEDYLPEPDECGAGLSGPSILWWPLVDQAED
jgi:hypothetical protein